jgi:chromosome partitioning protein
MSQTRQISILNFKGGIGKSTLAVNLGHALAMSGRRVLLVDCDMQSNTSVGTLLLEDQAHPTITNVLKREASFEDAIKPTGRENLFVVPSDSDLDTAATHITGRRQSYYILRDAVGKLQGYDYIFFDHSPSYGPVTEAALLASSEMVIPCELVPYAVQGLFLIFNKLQETLTDHELTNSGIIPFNVDMRYAMTKTYQDEIKQVFGEFITPVMVRTDAMIPRSQSNRRTIFEQEQVEGEKSRAAEDFKSLAEYFIGSTVNA